MMKDLLYKEFMLARHPTLFIFPFLGTMLLIPSYPYFVAFIYTCLSIFFIFLQGRENKDLFFTACLPVQKRDIVKARCLFIGIIEVFQILVSIPFAIIGSRINPNAQGNLVGMEANIAFFGFVFILYALFNIIYLPMFYKTAYRVGLPLVYASIVIAVYIVGLEAAIQIIPALKDALDTRDPGMVVRQLPILAAGIVIYALAMLQACKKAAVYFEKVDL
jgi:hypothetical protein